MPSVLTTSSNVTCGHSGRVTTVSTAKLHVSGSPVLLRDSINNKAVTDCATPPASDASGPTAAPCTLVASTTTGQALKLKAGGQGVMLDTLAGTTNGMVAKTTPQTLLAATALQTRLTAR